MVLVFARSPEYGLYALFFSSAILVAPNLPVVGSKLALPEFVALCAWIGFLLSRQPVQLERASGAVLAGVPFLAWYVLAFIVNAGRANEQGAFLSSLIETLNQLYSFSTFLLVALIVDRTSTAWRCVLAWLAGAVVVCVVGLITLAGHGPDWALDDNTQRLSSTLRRENQVPSFLIPVLPAALLFAASRLVAPPLRLGLYALAFAIIAVSYGTGSRTALVMLVLVLMGVVWVVLRETGRGAIMPVRLFALFAMLTTALVGATLYIQAQSTQYASRFEAPGWQRATLVLSAWLEGDEFVDGGRVNQIRDALTLMPDEPVFGVGPALFKPMLGGHEVHNSYVGAAVEAGIPAAVFLIFWFAYLMVHCWAGAGSSPHAPTRLLACSLLIGLAALLCYGLPQYGLRQRNIWLVCGLMACLPQLAAAMSAQTRRVPAAPAYAMTGAYAARQ